MSKQSMAGLLLLASIFGGMTAALTKGAVEVVPPVLFASIRFGIAFAVLFLVQYRRILSEFKREDIRPILFISVFMAGGFILYNLSLLFTSATNACFFFSMSTLIIPFFAKWINGTKFRGGLLWGLAVTMAGMYFLVMDGGGFSMNKGDMLAVSSAVFFALQVVLTGRYAERIHPLVIADLQFLFVSILTLGVSLAMGESFRLVSYGIKEWGAILFAGILGTAMLYLVQTIAQMSLKESTVGMIYAFIPLFTAVTAWVCLGERLSAVGIAGGGLMIAGVILACRLNAIPSGNDIEGSL